MVLPSGVPAQLRRGVLEYCVLGLLREKDRYAFDLVRQLSEEGLVASEGTIYPLLARLRREQLVQTTWQESTTGPPRRYYRLTTDGSRRLDSFVAQWATFSGAVDSILSIKGKRP